MTFVKQLNEKKWPLSIFSSSQRQKIEILSTCICSLKLKYWHIHSFFRGEFFVAGVNGEERPRVEKREWDVKAFNYDNCGIAMITLFAVQTSEGWVE